MIIIGSDNGLSPGQCQAIIWINAGILLIGPLGTNLSEILIEIFAFSFKEMHLKMLSVKWQPFCPGGGMSLPFKWWSHMFLSQCVQDKHQVPEILDPRLGMKQLFSDITKDQWLHNYANPVYGVATICHQVRWLRWGHPKLFHTATSLLIWYKMFCVRDISYRLIWMEFINMFSVYAKSGTHSRFNW